MRVQGIPICRPKINEPVGMIYQKSESPDTDILVYSHFLNF